MRKMHLKNGMIVETRDGCLFKICITDKWGALTWFSETSTFDLNLFDEELIYIGDKSKIGDKADIVKVYEVPNRVLRENDIKRMIGEDARLKPINQAVLLWERIQG